MSRCFGSPDHRTAGPKSRFPRVPLDENIMIQMKNDKTAKDRPTVITVSESRHPDPLHKGFNPEMVYVECGRCGSPVLWEPGRTTELFRSVGIDPLELDSSCVLVSDGCPSCSGRGSFNVQVVRVTKTPPQYFPKQQGNA